MIHIAFKKNTNDEWVSFEISGHANFADNGSDIVCAAVSVLAISTCNSLERLVKYQPIIDVEEELGGYLYCEVITDLSPDQKKATQLLLQHLYDSLCDVEKDYSNFVSIDLLN